MKASAIRVFVHDLAEAQSFYAQTLGLQEAGGSIKSGFLIFEIGGITLIIEEASGEANLIGRFVGLSFETKDILALYKSLKSKGVEFEDPPRKQKWGGMLTHFKDVSGNILTLVQYPSTGKDS